jgi:hypothetical protein
MEWIIDRDETLDEVDQFGLVPAAYAAFYNNIEIMSLLFDVEGIHCDGRGLASGLYLACYAKRWDAIKYFIGP